MKVSFRVLLDGGAPRAHMDPTSTADGSGLLDDDRLYQLVRQPGTVEERTFAIAFRKPGVEAYVFTHG
jgi:hypothetical protein